MRTLLQLLICSLLVLITVPAIGQNISVNEDYEVQEMVQRHIQANKSKVGIDGWRIQILSASDRSKIEEAKSEFNSYFPGIYSDWLHVKPNYKLRAGAYRTRLDCNADLARIKKKFPSAYPTKVRGINPKEIIGW